MRTKTPAETTHQSLRGAGEANWTTMLEDVYVELTNKRKKDASSSSAAQPASKREKATGIGESVGAPTREVAASSTRPLTPPKELHETYNYEWWEETRRMQAEDALLPYTYSEEERMR